VIKRFQAQADDSPFEGILQSGKKLVALSKERIRQTKTVTEQTRSAIKMSRHKRKARTISGFTAEYKFIDGPTAIIDRLLGSLETAGWNVLGTSTNAQNYTHVLLARGPRRFFPLNSAGS